tara:strand:+ start:5348 stop:5593 length:246 start_codon:yes stop_codon:yes gene_type:complete
MVKMSNCKKCLAGAMRVHILSSGFCQECQQEMDWKNGDREARKQANRARRIKLYEKLKKGIDRKWKDKYGNSSIKEVRGHK